MAPIWHHIDMTRINVRLGSIRGLERLKKVDKLAKKWKLSRAGVIRKLIDKI